MVGQCDQLISGNAVFFVGLMRMGPDGAVDLVVFARDRKQSVNSPHPRRDRDDTPDARRLCPRDDAVEIVGKVRKVEMAMAVDKHRFRSRSRRLDVTRKYRGRRWKHCTWLDPLIEGGKVAAFDVVGDAENIEQLSGSL